MTMLAEIPLVQLFFLDLILAFRCCKGPEVACRALDPTVLHMVIVAENNGVGAGGLEGHITSASDREGGERAEAEHEDNAQNGLLHRLLVMAPAAVLLVLHIKGFFSIVAFAAEIAFIDAGHVHFV